MYISDYGYAVSETCKQILWNYYNNTCQDNDWLNNAYDQWTLTPLFDSSLQVTIIHNDGRGGIDKVDNHWLVLRPVLYLNPSVQIVSGDGTSSNPYILAM